jgi:hypothetical protein
MQRLLLLKKSEPARKPAHVTFFRTTAGLDFSAEIT